MSSGKSAIDQAREALEKIARWNKFPASGRTWDDGVPMSYSAAYGSNGERDYMRQVALDALAALRPIAEKSTPFGLPSVSPSGQDVRATASVQPAWKIGNEYAPYHPSASHVLPDYRDGWNACYYAGARATDSGWISVKDRLHPEKPGLATYEQIPCLIVRDGRIMLRQWNCEHLVWDDEWGDDFYCQAADITYWMEIPAIAATKEQQP